MNWKTLQVRGFTKRDDSRQACVWRKRQPHSTSIAARNRADEKALDIAQGIEAASKDVQKLQQQPTSSTVQTVQQPKLPRYPPRNHSRREQQHSSSCYRCGGNHQQSSCRFKNGTCHNCGKRGHISKVCRSSHKLKDTPRPTQNFIQENESPPQVPPSSNHNPASDEDVYNLFTLRGNNQPFQVQLQLNSCSVTMEVDTGAALSLINEATYQQITPTTPLKNTSIKTVYLYW